MESLEGSARLLHHLKRLAQNVIFVENVLLWTPGEILQSATQKKKSSLGAIVSLSIMIY